ncbi:MAG: tetratricopeptide repeat protein [Chloroflexota bacterium]
MPKMIKRRIEKKEDKEEDIRETIGDLRERLRSKQRSLVLGLVAFLVVVSVGVGFLVYNRITVNKSLELAAEGNKIFYGNGTASPLPPAERYKKALALFKESYDKKQRAPVLLYIAYCDYELGNYDETIKSLKELVARYSEPEVVPFAYLKMSDAYLKKNDPESALTMLKNLASIKGSALQDVALLETGKILESQGKPEEAKKAYRDLVAKFPKSGLVQEAKAKLGEKEG